MKTKIVFTFLITILFFSATKIMAQQEKPENTQDKLVIVWTSDDPYLAERMVLMYAHAAKTAGWFKEVTIIIWGPSAKMVSNEGLPTASPTPSKISNKISKIKLFTNANNNQAIALIR